MSLSNSKAVAKRTMHLFFMVDASRRLEGFLIDGVNDAMRSILPIVREISDSNADAEIKIAALIFSDGCEWLYNEPKSVEDFEWIDQTAFGWTDLGAACQNLEKVLHHRNGWMDFKNDVYAPVFILFSASRPTDDFDSGVATLWKNNWFKMGVKVAIAMGEDADIDVLAKFTGNIERVIRVHEVETLKEVFSFFANSDADCDDHEIGWSATDDEWSEDTVTEALKHQLEEEDIEIITDINTDSDNDEEW